MDYIVSAPKINYGETARVSDYVAQGGGLIGTAMVACARLGASSDLLCILGDDHVGDQILAELEAEGISSTHIIRAPGGRSPFSFIHVDENSGERTIFHRPGTGLGFDLECINWSIASSWDALLVDDIFLDLSIAAARAVRKRGVPVVADLIPDDRNMRLLKLVDVLIAPRHYARQIGLDDNLDSALDSIHDLGPATAVITLGAEGWVYSDLYGKGRGEAFKVDVVDTTGAGDTFHGAFTYGLARGWDTARCCEFASAVAAIKCMKPGGRTGLPSLPEVMAFLDTNSDLCYATR